MEGSFADAANNHGFKRACWRGLWRQQIQDWLIAAVQNLRILLKKGGKWSGQATGSAALMLRGLLHSMAALLLLQSVSAQHEVRHALNATTPKRKPMQNAF